MFCRNTLTSLITAAALSLVSMSHAALPIQDSQQQSLPTLAPLIKKISPAVVSISIKATQNTQQNPLMNDPFFRQFFNQPRQPRRSKPIQSAGSDVIVDAEKGTIITNHHVIEKAEEIHINLADGRSFEATLVGSDPEVDIAILNIKAKQLTAVTIANSDKTLVGDFVVAVGNPFGLGQTVTTGVVSALGRSGLGIEGYENFIQTDASINPGNSGGALLNLRGELVGINTAIIAPSGGNIGIGFAIPTNMAMASLEQIIEFGAVRRGRLGVYIQDLNPALREAFKLNERQKGVLVTKVEESSSADKAGLKEADIITHINDKSVDRAAQLRNAIGIKKIGDEIQVSFIRNGQQKEINVILTAANKTANITQDQQQSGVNKLAGARLKNINSGVLVTDIESGSAADKASLKTGDVIIGADRMKITDISDLNEVLKNNKNKGLLLRIIRQNVVLYLAVR